MPEAAATYRHALEDRQVLTADDLMPKLITTPAEMLRRMKELQEFVDQVMKEGKHYGPPFPGSDKLMLYKPGAELLAEIYAYSVLPRVTHRIELWNPPDGPFFHYEFEAPVESKRSGLIVAKGFGSCNSRENRYRWRNASRTCPECGAAAIRKSQYGGLYCNQRAGGCNTTFKESTAAYRALMEQEVGRVENDDVCTLVNTVLRVAKKRSFVDGVITVTQSSNMFDVGDEEDEGPRGDDRSGGDERTGGDASRGNQRRTSGGSRQGGRGAASQGGNGNAPASSGGSDKPPDEAHPNKVLVNGQVHWTSGVGFKSLMRVWELLRAYDGRFGKDAGKGLMKQAVGVESSHDLNEDMAVQVIDALQTALDNAGDPPPAGQTAAPY